MSLLHDISSTQRHSDGSGSESALSQETSLTSSSLDVPGGLQFRRRCLAGLVVELLNSQGWWALSSHSTIL
jgi:hypothetical protein